MDIDGSGVQKSHKQFLKVGGGKGNGCLALWSLENTSFVLARLKTLLTWSAENIYA